MSPDIILLVVAGALLVFMLWSSSRRKKKMQEEEQKRQASMLPGARVMTRAGLYGTLVAFDADDLTRPAVIEIAPGVEVEVHAQTVMLDPDAQVAEYGDDASDEGAHDRLDDEPAEPEVSFGDDRDERRDDDAQDDDKKQ